MSRKIDQNAKAMQQKLNLWLIKYATLEAKKGIKRAIKKPLPIKKDNRSDIENELLAILSVYGVRQVGKAGSLTSEAFGGSWKIKPSLVSQIIASKQIAIKNIIDTVQSSVNSQIQSLLTDAQKEEPRPSVGEVARRLSLQFFGPGEGAGGLGFKEDKLSPGVEVGPNKFLNTQTGIAGDSWVYTFSSARSSLIARTESSINENTGIYAGYEQAEAIGIEWVSSWSLNHGDRRHDKMDGKKIKFGEYFTTPLGNKMRYPGDPDGPIKELANCGCTHAPVFKSKKEA